MRRMSDLVRNRNPLILPPNASIKEAARQMRDRRVVRSWLPKRETGSSASSLAVMPLPAS